MHERPESRDPSSRYADAWSPDAFGRDLPMTPSSRMPHERESGGVWTVIKSNPVPAALAAVGLGWLWTHRASGSQGSQGSPSSAYTRSQTASAWGAGSSSGASSGSSPYAGQAMGGQMGTQGTGQTPSMGTQVQDAAGQVVGQAQQMGGQVQEMAGQVVDQASQVVGQAGQVVGQVPTQIQQQAQGLWQRIEGNPAVSGALGAVLGGITALLVPETQKENQLLGETRDRVLSTVQEKAEEAVATVQAVAEDVGQAAMTAGQAAMGELGSQPQDSGSTDSGKNQGSGKSGTGKGGGSGTSS